MILSQNQNEDKDEKQKKVPYHFGEKLRQVREKKGCELGDPPIHSPGFLYRYNLFIHCSFKIRYGFNMCRDFMQSAQFFRIIDVP